MPVSETAVSADSYGYIGFYGPSGFTADLWVEDGSGNRLLVRPTNLTARVGALETTVGSLPGSPSGALTKAQADALYATPASVTSGLAGKVSTDTLMIDMADHGVNPANSYSVNQAALVALFAAAPVTGATYYLPPGGIVDIDGGIDIPPFCTIQLSSPSGRYWGYNSTTMPVSPSAFRIRAGSTQPYAFRLADDFNGDTTRDSTGVCLRDFTLLGNNAGTNMVGLLFSGTTLESNFRAHGVRIIGMSGDGIATGTSGKMWAQEWWDTFIGGCGGYGISATGTAQIVDC